MASADSRDDSFRKVFTDKAVCHLVATPNPGEELVDRLEAIRYGEPGFVPRQSAIDPDRASKRQAAWASYFASAEEVGLFEGESGCELLGRLRSRDRNDFRSGVAECLAAWFLAETLGLELRPRPQGRAGGPLELCIVDGAGSISVEVKAPRRPRPTEPWWGDDSDLLAKSLEQANKQFRADTANLLFLAPELPIPLFEDREQMISAFFGHLLFSMRVNPEDGQLVEPGTTRFEPDGHLLNPLRRDGRPYKATGRPRFTRVSAVICVERGIGDESVEHYPLLAHNPFAAHPVSETLWQDVPQLVVRGEHMMWTDFADKEAESGEA